MTDRTYYVHDTSRGCVGNSMVWWKHNDCGYVTDIRQARVFKECELGVLMAGDLRAYPTEYINERVSFHVDMQNVDSSVAVSRPPLSQPSPEPSDIAAKHEQWDANARHERSRLVFQGDDL